MTLQHHHAKGLPLFLPQCPEKNRFLPADFYTGGGDVENELFSIRLQGVMSHHHLSFYTENQQWSLCFSPDEAQSCVPLYPEPWLSCRTTTSDPSVQRPPWAPCEGWLDLKGCHYSSTWLILTMADLETHKTVRPIICHPNKMPVTDRQSFPHLAD